MNPFSRQKTHTGRIQKEHDRELFKIDRSQGGDDYDYDESARGQLIGSVYDSSEKEII